MKVTCALLALLALAGSCLADEFLGPFPSWVNVKTDYGAVGDGNTDDTAAIQRGLEDIRKPDFPKRVLYFPAGVYRITSTIKLLRESHTQSQGVAIYGEDPEKTIIQWDGPADGVMFHYNPWFSAIGRLTLDGKGKAKTALEHGELFTTANEISDMVFKDVQFGIEAGMKHGIAETAVLRCRFYRCAKAAVSIQNFNSLDWYIWHSWFEDCGIGVTNEFGAGNFHVYESTFLRSTEADVTIRHTGYFGLYGNHSEGSKRFLHAKRHPVWKDTETWGANFTLQRNHIESARETTPILFENNGPLMLLDNMIVNRGNAPSVIMQPTAEKGDLISIGNIFGSKNPLKTSGRKLSLDDSTPPIPYGSSVMPKSHPFAPVGDRPIIEVQGKDGAAIQQAIDEAVKLNGKRPVVHIPAGSYQVKHTIVIPADTDLQLVGDGLILATALNWAGGNEGPLLRIEGPTHATMRNIGINAGKNVRAIETVNCDQPGGRIFMEQAQTNGYEYGLVVDGLDHTDVFMHDHGHNGMQVLGSSPAAEGKIPESMTTLFCGASSRHKHHKQEGVDLYNVDKGGRLMIRDIWYEGEIWHFLNLTGSGEFTYHSGIVAPYAGPTADSAVLAIDGFKGKVTLSQIEPVNGPFRVSGGGKDTKVLALGLIIRDMPLQFEKAGPGVKVAFLNGRDFRKNGTGTDSLPDVGKADADFVRDMLKTLRTERPCQFTPIPEGITDLRFYRVMIDGREGMRIQ